MKIKNTDITIHPISSERRKGFLYYNNNKLYRSPSPKYAPILKIAAALPYVQKTELTEHVFNFKGTDVPVYEHKIYPHRTRIQEMPPPKKKEIIEVLCDLNVEASKKGILCREMHEANINYTIDGIKYIDMTGFGLTNNTNATHSVARINYFVQKYLKSSVVAGLKLDFTKTSSWEKLRDIISKLPIRKLETSGWFTGYSHDMNIYDPINEKAQCVWDIINKLRGVETATDVGSNKGYYTCLAARKIKSVIGFEADESCVNFAIDINKKKFKLPVVFGCTKIQNLMADKLFEHDRYKSDLVLALAIAHHLHRMGNDISHKKFAQMLMKYSNKYIIFEEIGLEMRTTYQDLFHKGGFKLIERHHTGPDKRHVALYKKK